MGGQGKGEGRWVEVTEEGKMRGRSAVHESMQRQGEQASGAWESEQMHTGVSRCMQKRAGEFRGKQVHAGASRYKQVHAGVSRCTQGQAGACRESVYIDED